MLSSALSAEISAPSWETIGVGAWRQSVSSGRYFDAKLRNCRNLWVIVLTIMVLWGHARDWGQFSKLDFPAKDIQRF